MKVKDERGIDNRFDDNDYQDIIDDFHRCSNFAVGCENCKASSLMPDSKFTTYCDFLRYHVNYIQEKLEKAFNNL